MDFLGFGWICRVICRCLQGFQGLQRFLRRNRDLYGFRGIGQLVGNKTYPKLRIWRKQSLGLEEKKDSDAEGESARGELYKTRENGSCSA